MVKSDPIISTVGIRNGLQNELAQLASGNSATSQGWNGGGGVANRAFFIPIMTDQGGFFRKLWWALGATALGNTDLGIYESALGKPTTRIVSTGPVANDVARQNKLQEVTVPQFYLRPSTLYFMGMVTDNVSNNFLANITQGLIFSRIMGCCNMSAAMPLPATVSSLLNASQQAIYLCGVSRRSVMA